MDGARRHDHSAPEGMPPPELVHRIHDRYLLEIVEGLGLCPFARRSRELGRVHRPLVYGPPTPHVAADRLAAVLGSHPDAEIVLLTFVSGSPQPLFASPRDLDEFVKGVRAAYGERVAGDAPDEPAAAALPEFFMVGFHPQSGRVEPGEQPPPLTADSLVPKLRRTPDPVIQCVQARVLQDARITAQKAAHARLMDNAHEYPPQMRAILERSIMPDSVLSADIAKHNFEAVAKHHGRQQLEALIADIKRQRDREYAQWWS